MKAARLKAWLPMSPIAPPAGLRRIGPPGGLLLPRLLEPRGQPVLRIFGLHDPDLAELARLHALARLAHHGEPCVVVGQPEHEARALHGPNAGRARPRRLVVIGLSQMTWMPASRNALAAGWWTWFGVTIATASMPSARAASLAAISAKLP